MDTTSGSGHNDALLAAPGVNCSAGTREAISERSARFGRSHWPGLRNGSPADMGILPRGPAGLRWFQGSSLHPGLQGSARRICLLVQDITEQKVPAEISSSYSEQHEPVSEALPIGLFEIHMAARRLTNDSCTRCWRPVAKPWSTDASVARGRRCRGGARRYLR